MTIKDIARIAGVSIATVSRVVNDKPEGVGPETRERIKRVIIEYDYRTNLLAKSMITKRTRSLGLILPDVSNPFFSNIAKSVELAAMEEGYQVFLCNTDEDFKREQNYIAALRDKNVDGLVFIPTTRQKRDERALRFMKPVVLVDRLLPGDFVGVYTDNMQGCAAAAEHLIQLGHKRIAYVGGPVNDSNASDRLKGFMNACAKFELDIPEQNIMAGSYTINTGLDYAKAILRLGVTACVCANDLIAIGLISVLKREGRHIPGDISVTGFDDSALSEINDPPLTTVRQPQAAMGRMAIELLVRMIAGERVKSRTLQTSLIIRESCKST